MYWIFRALLAITHLLYGLFILLHNFCRILHRKCIKILHSDSARTEVEILVSAADKMQKLPRHLVIVFGPKEDTIFECVRIIGWCITLGIPYISFFDSTGFLRKNEMVLQNEVAKRKPDLAEYISWGKPSTSLKNGVIGPTPKIRVWLISDVDGKGEIVALTQELATAVKTGSIKPEEINDNLLSEKLSLRGIPDPDLALVYGRICSTYGLLPWHTRTTEFLLLPPCTSITVEDFSHLLERYTRCTQRYGK